MIDFEINDKGTLVWNDGSSRPATHQEQELTYEIAYRDDQIKALQAEVDRLKSEQKGELWYALDYGFEGQYYEVECVIEDFESDYGAGDIEEVKVAQLTTVKHPNKFLAKLWVDGDARLFDTREEAEAAIAESKERAND